MQATLIKRTQCERALDADGSESLTFSYQISALSKSCYYHIRELRCLRPYLDFKTASTIATSIVHSKLDYCNLLYYNLPQSQIKKTPEHPDLSCSPKSSHITSVLKSLHWLKINECIKYKLLSLTYKVLTTHQPQYLHDVISVQPCHDTRSLSMVTLPRPPTRSSLKITNRSFRYAAPCLWNELPTDLREPRQTQSPALSPITHGILSSSPSSLSPLASSLTRSVFHSELKLGSSANPFFHRPFPFLPDWLHGLSDHLTILLYSTARLVC